MHDQSRIGQDAVVHFADPGIGNELACNRKLVIGQGGDKSFACFDGFLAGKQQGHALPRAGKSDTRPSFLRVGKHLSTVIAQRQQCIA